MVLVESTCTCFSTLKSVKHLVVLQFSEHRKLTAHKSIAQWHPLQPFSIFKILKEGEKFDITFHSLRFLEVVNPAVAGAYGGAFAIGAGKRARGRECAGTHCLLHHIWGHCTNARGKTHSADLSTQGYGALPGVNHLSHTYFQEGFYADHIGWSYLARCSIGDLKSFPLLTAGYTQRVFFKQCSTRYYESD